MLSCLNTFAFDSDRNKYVESVVQYVPGIHGTELAYALSCYSFDDGREKFTVMVQHKILPLGTEELIQCLSTYSFDSGKDKFLEIVGPKTHMVPTDIGRINKCFSFGSKKLSSLFIDKQTGNTILPYHQKINLIDFLRSLDSDGTRMSDENKYMSLQAMMPNLVITDVHRLPEYFRCVRTLKKVYQLLNIDDSVSQIYLKELEEKMSKFWVNGQEYSLKGGLTLGLELQCGFLNINALDPEYCTIEFRSVHGGYSRMSGISLSGKCVYVNESGISLSN